MSDNDYEVADVYSGLRSQVLQFRPEDETGLEGVGGLEKLSSVVVKGTVAEGSSADALIINATAIHVAK